MFLRLVLFLLVLVFGLFAFNGRLTYQKKKIHSPVLLRDFLTFMSFSHLTDHSSHTHQPKKLISENNSL